MDNETYNKIIKRKQFSQLRKIDVELAWKHFENKQTSLNHKIKLTRNLLGKSLTMFTSNRFFKSKLFKAEEVLKKHLSTKERFEYYGKIYEKIFCGMKGKISVCDFGAGLNGFSYSFFPKNVSYFGFESIGQLVNLMNLYFNKNKYTGAKTIHMSLFELSNIKKLIKNVNGKKIVFLFKVLDSLEMIEKNYSKKLLKEIVPLVDKIVVSFATKSLLRKNLFFAKRNWILDFIKENFLLIEEFEFADEKYVIFSKK